MSHADVLDIDRGHIFRKHRHKNNKKVAVIYEKTVKNRPLPGYLPASCHGARALKVRFPTCVVCTRTYLTRKANNIKRNMCKHALTHIIAKKCNFCLKK